MTMAVKAVVVQAVAGMVAVESAAEEAVVVGMAVSGLVRLEAETMAAGCGAAVVRGRAVRVTATETVAEVNV